MPGEATPDYIDDPLFAAARIKRELPKTRFIVIFRDPIERAHAGELFILGQSDTALTSHCRPAWDQMRRVKGGLETRSFEEAIRAELPVVERCLQHLPQGHGDRSGKANEADEEAYFRDCVQMCWQFDSHVERPWCRRYIQKGFYTLLLEQWLDFFPRSQFLLLHSEALFREPKVALDEVHSFLGLGPADTIQSSNAHDSTGESTSNNRSTQTCWHDCEVPKRSLNERSLSVELRHELEALYARGRSDAIGSLASSGDDARRPVALQAFPFALGVRSM
jgi:hypothetical protein